jgi:nitrogen regulatory protein PII
MAKLVVLITARDDVAQEVGEGWQKVGSPGVTIIEGYGLQRIRQASPEAEILPGMMSLIDILRSNKPTSFILLALLEVDAPIEAMLKVTQEILGDLQSPENGIFFVIDVERAVGIRNHGE